MQTLSPPSSESTRIEVNVSEFSRGEITVKLRRDNTLLVHALHLDQFSIDNFFRKELMKTFPIPTGADMEKIRSVIRSNGILTIDIPMIRDRDAIRRSHEELLKIIDSPSKQNKIDSNHLNLQIDETNSNQLPMRTSPVSVPKRTGSLGNLEHRSPTSKPSPFNIAEFLQSTFHPTFTSNGRKLILKVDTRGYDTDELTVRLLDYDLLVQGRKKSLSTKNKQQTKQFSQSIRLPTGIDKYNVTSQVLENGVLVIDVPLLNSNIYYH